MARYPFTAEANKFIREIAPYTAEITLKDKSRKLKLIARKLDKLQEDGRIKTANPRNFTVKDMITYVNSRRLEGISESTISKDVSLLNQFFISIGNHCVEEFRVRAGNVRPHAYTGKKDGIPDDIVERVYKLARETDDWHLMEGLMVVVMTVSTGIRPQESRIFDIDGIHLMGDRSFIFIKHVKGEGKYGKPRPAPIMDGAEDIFEKYLRMRKERLDHLGVKTNAMFPNFRYPVRKYLCQQAFCRLKQRVEVHMGVKFELRAGRRSFGQRALDDGQELENVSVAMGHASTRTTELFYARRATDRAIKGMFAHKNGGGAKAFE